jgi:ElaB/YqjD/DUF883 family membrane-anchored ribosome-binding protein
MATTRKEDDTEAPGTEALQAEMAALRADLGELATLVSRIGRKRAAGLRSAAGSAARESYAKGEAAFDDILGELESLEQDLADAARRRPFASMGLAALVGFLVGVLFRR